MKICNRNMTGQVNGVWMTPGLVFEVDDENGARYVELGYAVEVKKAEKKAEPEEEHAVASKADVETATPKRGPGRPRKDA